ncbi:MAG: HAD family hydrolase [Phycisphaerae bacterium]|jgi:hypothetical protein
MLPARLRLIAIDLDGTLLDSQGGLPARNRTALHRAHEIGLKLVLCTGRSFTETRPVLGEIGLDLDATVTVGGALLSDARTGRTFEATPFDSALAAELTRWLLDDGNTVLRIHDAFAAGYDGFAIGGRRRHPAVDRWIEKTPCAIREVSGLPFGAPPPLRITVVDEGTRLRELAGQVQSRYDGRVTFNVIEVRSLGFTVLEMFSAPVNKWFGIQKLAARWGIPRGEIAAVGDDVNDLPMIREAGLGAAVGNAGDEVKLAANVVLPRNDDCGVAMLIERIIDSDTGA